MNIYSIKPAIITNVSLTMADHGTLTFYITLKECNSSENHCLGGYAIGKGYLGADNFEGSAIGLEAMMRIMDTVGVATWEDLVGKKVLIGFHEPYGGMEEITNIETEKSFNIQNFFNSNTKVATHTTSFFTDVL